MNEEKESQIRENRKGVVLRMKRGFTRLALSDSQGPKLNSISIGPRSGPLVFGFDDRTRLADRCTIHAAYFGS